jgi:DNA-binding NtrC family response regulator
MKKTLLKGKDILAVDDEPDVLEILDEELAEYGVRLDTASSYEEASHKIMSYTYDLVVLDIMGVRGFDLLEMAVAKKFPVVMLTAHAVSPESLKKSIELGARAYLLKDQLPTVAAFVEDVLELSYRFGWRRSLEKLGGYFGKRFGPDWRKTEQQFWEQFEKGLEVEESTILVK